MKTRKQLRFLYQRFEEEVSHITHNCQLFYISGTGCMMCRLINHGYPFAAVQLARENGLLQVWFSTEREMRELLGEAAFANRVELQICEVKNFPKVKCDECEGIMTAFLPFTKMIKELARVPGYTLGCENCGHRTRILEQHLSAEWKARLKKEIALRKERNAQLQGQPVLRTRRLHRVFMDEPEMPRPEPSTMETLRRRNNLVTDEI